MVRIVKDHGGCCSSCCDCDDAGGGAPAEGGTPSGDRGAKYFLICVCVMDAFLCVALFTLIVLLFLRCGLLFFVER